MIPVFDCTAPWLILAPHLKYPLVNGADISIENIGKYISHHVEHVTIVGQKTIRIFKMAQLVEEKFYLNEDISKISASIRTLLFRDHYLKSKFNTSEFNEQAVTYLDNAIYKTVLYSFISTTAVKELSVPHSDRVNIVWTHNDEFKWFEDIKKKTINPLAKLAASLSLRWLRNWFHENSGNYLLLHVTEDDASGYCTFFPNHKFLQVSIGVEEEDTRLPIVSHNTNHNTISLLFLGSLSNKMNLDALNHFKDSFYFILEKQLAGRLTVKIVGSNPSPGVRRVCQECSWELYPNVDNNGLVSLLHQADFSIMPFQYVTGAKLKLLKTLANGLPFLGTSAMASQLDYLPTNCLLSDDPQEWVEHLLATANRGGIPPEDRAALQVYARQFSWRSVATKLYNSLQ